MGNSVDKTRDRITQIYEKITVNDGESREALEKAFAELNMLFEELSVAEEELHVSNENLILERMQSEHERRRYQHLFEFAPDAYLVTDAKGVIREANRAAAELLQVAPERLLGKPMKVFVPKQEVNHFYRLLRATGRSLRGEITLLPRGGQALAVDYTLVAVPDGSDSPSDLRWTLRDMTERNRSRTALAASERRFRATFQYAHIGILLLDRAGYILESNPAFQEMTGYAAKDLLLAEMTGLLWEEDRETFERALAALKGGSEDYSCEELRFTSRSSETIWGRVTLSAPGGEGNRPSYIVLMVENITAEKKATEEVEELQHRLLGSIELERLRLAQELHDGPLQDLYAAAYRLSPAKPEQLDEELAHSINEAQEMIKHVASTVRAICGDLRPPTLQNLGLEKAIRSHMEKIHDQAPDLEVRLVLDDGLHALPPNTRLALFRIYQQCITNTLRYAQANLLEVKLQSKPGQVVLQVWDDGRGFVLPDSWMEWVRTGHYGLAGIAERVTALRGNLFIDTKPDGGTLIRVTVPI